MLEHPEVALAGDVSKLTRKVVQGRWRVARLRRDSALGRYANMGIGVERLLDEQR
jgi:hypothetical protein